VHAKNERALTFLRFLLWSFFSSFFLFFCKPFPPYSGRGIQGSASTERVRWSEEGGRTEVLREPTRFLLERLALLDRLAGALRPVLQDDRSIHVARRTLEREEVSLLLQTTQVEPSGSVFAVALVRLEPAPDVVLRVLVVVAEEAVQA
jgi:hypothetical protein